MNANSTFWIGKDHTVCEDYAIAKVEADLAYAIVCDGCSASPDVDFGARVLALSAKEKIISTSPLRKALDVDFDPTTFGNSVIRHAATVARHLPSLHPQVLDATLLAAWVTGKEFKAYLYGDGVIVHRTKLGVLTHHIHLTSGAPDYLSYFLDQSRQTSYNKLLDNYKEIEHRFNGELRQGGKFTYNPFQPLVITGIVEEGDVIAVISDGINSFRKSDDENIDWKELIEEFTGYKSTTGEFVLRRISAFMRKCKKEGIHFCDDISIAAIVV